jgi:hypothetical protein
VLRNRQLTIPPNVNCKFKKDQTKKIVIPILIFLLTLNSCKKDKEETPVFAGDINLEMLHYEFNPALQVQFQTDSLKKIKFGIDSIDIDLDNNFDIIISQRIYIDWTDDFNRSYLEEDDFPFIGLRLKNGFEVAFKQMPFPTGLGTTNSVAMVDTLLPETRIDKIIDWHDSNMHHTAYMGYYNNSIWLWGAPPASFWLLGNYGAWYKLNNREMYIGIRKKTDTGYKLGWIKVKVYNYDKFEILSYAIEK